MKKLIPIIAIAFASCSKQIDVVPQCFSIEKSMLSGDTISFLKCQTITYSKPTNGTIYFNLNLNNAQIGASTTIITPIKDVVSFAINTIGNPIYTTQPTQILSEHTMLNMKITYVGGANNYYSIESFSY